MLSRILYCVIGFCAVSGHAQLAATASPSETLGQQAVVPLAVKTYSTNVMNVVEPTTTIVPASQPALSAQTFVGAPAITNSNVIKIPDTRIASAVADNGQSANVTNNGLTVAVSAPKVAGQKAVVQLKMKNNLSDAVKSARAVCFLLDDQGKMVGQSTKWVIGQNKVGLEPKGDATFNFVITSPQPFTTTNLTAKISFSRVVLDGGKLADVQKDVSVTAAPQH